MIATVTTTRRLAEPERLTAHLDRLYTIVSGRPLPSPARTRRAVREGTVLRYFRRAAAIVVTWPRGGHTCVLSGRGVPTGTLLELAGWKGKGAVAF